MKKRSSITSTAQPKTIVAAVTLAICSSAVFAGAYDRSGATTPAIIAGDAGQNNSLNINGATIGSSGTPSTGSGGQPSLISVGGNNGATPTGPYDYGNITIDADNISLYGRNTSATGLEGIYAKTGTANAAVKIDLSNSTINVGSSGAYSNAILAEHRDASGQVEINITNSNLTNIYTGTASSAQTVFAASFGASSVITIDGNSTVTSSGNNAVGLQASANVGTATIKSGATINTTGNNAHGIVGSSGGLGVNIETTGGTINTSGAGSHGIAAYATDGNISITNLGNISSTGSAAHGIYAKTSSGQVSVVNTGNKTITSGGMGIHAEGAAITINSNSQISVTDLSSPTQSLHGIDAYLNAGLTGDTIVNYSGPSISIQGGNNTSGDMIAIRADSIPAAGATGKATVNASGNMDVHLTNGTVSWLYGIEAITHGSGAAENHYSGGIINATADAASTVSNGYGLLAWSTGGAGSGSATVTTAHGTEIHTAGDNIRGIRVHSEKGTAADGTIVKADVDSVITTAGNTGYGIWASTGLDATIDVSSKGSVTTSGTGSHAIYATGAGQINVDNYGALTTSGNNSKGIVAYYAGTSGGATVNHHAGASIITSGSNTTGGAYAVANGSAGIYMESASSTAVGDLLAIIDGDITIRGTNRSGGAFVYNHGIGNATIRATGNILTSGTTGPYSYGLSAAIADTGLGNNKEAAIYYTNAAGTVETHAEDSGALYAYINNNASGSVRIENAGTLKTFGNGASAGILARVLGGDGSATVINTGAITTAGSQAGSYSPHGISADALTGNVDVTNSGAITTSGHGSYGLAAATAGSGTVNISGNGAITTTSSSTSVRSYGILANTVDGLSQVNYAGAIMTSAVDSSGIRATASGTGNVEVNYTGPRIEVFGNNSDGIFVLTNAGSTKVNASGTIITHGKANGGADGTGSFAHGIAALSAQGDVVVNFTGDLIDVNGYSSAAIYADSKYPPAGTGVGTVTVTNTGSLITRGSSSRAIDVISSAGAVNIDNAGAIQTLGISNSAGIHTVADTAGIVISNRGTIDAISDQAIEVQNSVSGNLTLTNSGRITGAIQATNTSATVTNSGTWNLRNFADTNSDQTRDTLGVAVSNFGTSGNNSISNSGVIALLGDNAQATTLNNAGEYATGYTANTMALGGAAQAQILNVQTFTNSGVIDMGPANGAVGDVLVISGGSTVGTSGGGTYVANGGQVILDTVLNEGGANSQSDMLVLDGTQLGASADKIKVINVGGNGTQTVDNGIELVRVLDQSRSAGNVFQLSDRLVSGAYEYDLYQGGVGVDAGDGNWYLRSLSLPSDGGNSKPAPRPETGVYLGNMVAGSTMFMHTLHDRLGEPQLTDQNKGSNDQVGSAWVRVASNQTDSKAAGGEIDLSTDTTLVHLGGDLARWSSNGTDRWHFGLMGAYGQSDTDADSTHLQTTNSGHKRTANGKVDGYSIGAYATWYGNQDKPTGPYVDVWGQYGWFDNKVKGNTLAEESYDSTGYTLSVEGGYAFIARNSGNRQWMIEPQVQLAYNSYSADDHYEQNTNTWVKNGDTDGVIARVGTRLYSRSTLNDNGMQPFVEANWWYNGAKYEQSFNGQMVRSDVPDSTLELKVGLQGEISKGWQAWGHIGGRWGASSYSSYGGMVGVKHQF